MRRRGLAQRGMTLLEVLVALVILGLAGVAFLGLFGQNVRTSQAVDDWSRTVAAAETGLELLKTSPDIGDPGSSPEGTLDGSASGRMELEDRSLRWQRRRWSTGVDLVTVRVELPGGGDYRVSRLVPARR